jgi:hypothetical protein
VWRLQRAPYGEILQAQQAIPQSPPPSLPPGTPQGSFSFARMAQHLNARMQRKPVRLCLDDLSDNAF